MSTLSREEKKNLGASVKSVIEETYFRNKAEYIK